LVGVRNLPIKRNRNGSQQKPARKKRVLLTAAKASTESPTVESKWDQRWGLCLLPVGKRQRTDSWQYPVARKPREEHKAADHIATRYAQAVESSLKMSIIEG
jgi:hypothetical protein